MLLQVFILTRRDLCNAAQLLTQWRAPDQESIGAYRVNLTLVSTNKLFIRKPILNAYKMLQKGNTLYLYIRLFKRFQKGGRGR
jgi:hypothetical protein